MPSPTPPPSDVVGSLSCVALPRLLPLFLGVSCGASLALVVALTGVRSSALVQWLLRVPGDLLLQALVAVTFPLVALHATRTGSLLQTRQLSILWMRLALATLAASRPVSASHPDWPTFRVGINTGQAVVGNVGAADRHSFATIGDTTNTAARLEGMTKGRPYQLFLADATHGRLRDTPDDMESLDELEVRGRRAGMKVWALRPAATVPDEVPAAAEPNRASS